MSRPLLLDLFCGAGGAAKGYHDAGFDVVGVDIKWQPRYPGLCYVGDAMKVGPWLILERLINGPTPIAAIHASPPCRDHSALASVVGKVGTGHLLADTRAMLQQTGLPYVIENVEQADMPGALVLCGSEFGLTTTTAHHGRVWLKRHRKFESNVFLLGGGGCNCHGKLTVPVYGGGAGGARVGMRGPGVAQASREVMGIDWMTRDELDQAIPPAYTRHIGEQLLAAIKVGAS